LYSNEALKGFNELALDVITRYYPFIYDEEIVLPYGLTMHLRVKRWWIEDILPNSK
jgi:hypothetical protein